jgi:hypothetical protein
VRYLSIHLSGFLNEFSLSVHCTDLEFFTRCLPRCTARSWIRLRISITNPPPAIWGITWNLNPRIKEELSRFSRLLKLHFLEREGYHIWWIVKHICQDFSNVIEGEGEINQSDHQRRPVSCISEILAGVVTTTREVSVPFRNINLLAPEFDI